MRGPEGYHGRPDIGCFPRVARSVDPRLPGRGRLVHEGLTLDRLLDDLGGRGGQVPGGDLALAQAPAEMDLLDAVAERTEIDQARLDVADLAAERLEDRD